MSSGKRKLTITAFILFISSLIILITDIFKIPSNAGPEYNIDKIFYHTTNIIFWLSTPYLLSILIKKIIWKSEFKNSIGTKSIGMIEDMSIILIYFISFGILFTKLFQLEISIELILLLLMIMVATAFLRPRFLKMSKTGFIQAARPFKIGDWISLLNQSGNIFLVGKVISFDGKSVQLKTENNTLLMLPNSLLTNYVIENYQAIGREVQFCVRISLSPRVSIDQAKRILTAGAKHALLSLSNHTGNSPNVIITEVGKDFVEYKINFFFIPWAPVSPESIKDLILCNVVYHLGKAGIAFDYVKYHNILEQVALFDNLDKNDLEELFSSAKSILYRAGEKIIKQGDVGSSMFVLQEGLLNVIIRSNDKEDVKVGMITPGQFFGEMSLLTGEERSATIVTETDSVILEITKEALKKILNKKPDLINGFGEIMAERQSINLKKMDDLLNRKESFIQKFVAKIKSFFDL